MWDARFDCKIVRYTIEHLWIINEIYSVDFASVYKVPIYTLPGPPNSSNVYIVASDTGKKYTLLNIVMEVSCRK